MAQLLVRRHRTAEIMILLLYTACLITWARCHRVVKEYEAHPNVTILYPVKNISFLLKDDNRNKIKTNENLTNNPFLHNEQKSNTKSDKKENIEDSKESSKEFHKIMPDSTRKDKDEIITTIDEDIKLANLSNKVNDNIDSKEPKIYHTNWKIDTRFSPPKFENEEVSYNDNNTSINTTPHSGKEFKASPQLDNFYEEDTFVIPTQVPKESLQFAQDPSYMSVLRDFHKLNYKPPSFNYQEHVEPYKFENSLFSGTKDWNYSFGIQPTPTVETPVRIPAGGLYKNPDAFKDKPGFNGVDESFELQVKDEVKDSNENSLHKLGNPWKNFLHLVTALVPVGIIISALTPSIIKLDSTDNNPHFPSRFSRRSVNALDLPPISESCKRRLLCEIHSDANYQRNSVSPWRRKHCYKLYCEDPQALNKILHWLLLYHRSRDYRPTPHDRRGYIT